MSSSESSSPISSPECSPPREQETRRRKRQKKTHLYAVKNTLCNINEDMLVPVENVHSVGDFGSTTCPFCNALFWRNEHSNTWPCCRDGRVKLPKHPEYPPELAELYHGNDVRSKFFLNNIRKFNTSLAFSSMVSARDKTLGPGPVYFRVNGTVHHMIGALIPGVDEAPKFAQVYFWDPSEMKRTGVRRNHVNLPDTPQTNEIMKTLERVITKHNSHYQTFLTHVEQVRALEAKGALPPPLTVDNIQLRPAMMWH